MHPLEDMWAHPSLNNEHRPFRLRVSLAVASLNHCSAEAGEKYVAQPSSARKLAAGPFTSRVEICRERRPTIIPAALASKIWKFQHHLHERFHQAERDELENRIMIGGDDMLHCTN